ncbi:MAG: hypothetical protein J6B81_01565 [Spirochaetaceae bacterium]|nr:hypothetical protein [Spirochaetaceae bacterium]
MKYLLKKFVCTVVFFLLVSVLFAGGNRDITEKDAETMDSWQESFDITEKKAGTYNIMVTAEDYGGNQGIAGPYNVIIDPESDLPIVGVTNPVQNMRIPGNLNIVGTCIDDDAVAYVELVFDGADESPQRAEGADFWSYYLDTTQLSEGSHSIKVYGVDINGVKGHPVEVIWHLDRRQPVTTVENYAIGDLVSGKIDLEGIVTDGNGIKSLAYSVDGGVNYMPLDLKIDKNTGFGSFKARIDTTKMTDGAAVCWFKAEDNQGSTGLSSFLFFVDNTRPDVRILSPLEDEVVNGIFSIAGSAVDVVGLSSLTWSFGQETGSFDIIPGNPYWVKEFDLRNYVGKAPAFIITAVDTAGNVTTRKQSINVDHKTDMATIDVQYPVAGSVIAADSEQLFVRGIATDDDGIAQIYYSVNGGAESFIESDGIFTINLKTAFSGNMSAADGNVLSSGKHQIKLYAVDVHGIKGVPLIVDFTAQGELPIFTHPVISSSDGSVPYTLGMEIHPESESSFTTNVSAACGIASVEWFVNGQSAGSYVPKLPEQTTYISIPLNSSMPWGVVTIDVVAKDIYGRESKQQSLVYLTNLTRIESKQQVVLADSTVSGGVIDFGKHSSVTGFFAGGDAVSVELRPKTDFASVSLSGNTFTLVPGSARGTSEPVTVVIKSDRGFEYESESLQFVHYTEPPVVTLTTEGVSNGYEDVYVKGKINSPWRSSARYRIIPVGVQISSDGLIVSATAATAGASEFIPSEEDGSFEFSIPSAYFGTGISIIEIIARNFDGTEGYATHFVRKIPDLPATAADGKTTVTATRPLVTWARGNEIYYTVAYQGSIDYVTCTVNGTEISGCHPVGGAISYDMLSPGTNTVSVNGKAGTNVIVSSQYITQKSNPNIEFLSIAGKPYTSGQQIVVPQGSGKNSPVVTVKITSEDVLNNVSYRFDALSAIEGQPEIHGGDVSQTGKAVIRKTDNPKVYEADIPLQGLPVQWFSLAVTADSLKGLSKETAVVGVIREKPTTQINDEEKMYWLPAENGKIAGYFNVRTPLVASVAGDYENTSNIAIETNGKAVTISGVKCGVYKDIPVVVKDSEGVEYNAPLVTVESSYYAPTLVVDSPAKNQWVGNSVMVSGSASDNNGIAKVELSLDGGISWSLLQIQSALETTGQEKITFGQEISLNSYQDGLLPLEIRVTDTFGQETTYRNSIHKDTTPPQVQIITPAAEDVVNGETTIVFKVKDNGRLVSGLYNAPPVNVQEATVEEDETLADETDTTGATKTVAVNEKLQIELTSLPVITIGTPQFPMENGMTFEFADIVGNVQTVSNWDFVIDNQSDLPRSEIHLPEQDHVVTTDFIISGVVFDDDGGSKISYRIDDGEYIQLPDYDSAYSISVPLSSMTDNEHTVYVYAEDIHGVRGEEVSRTFHVSLEEPKGAVVEPNIEKTVKDTVTIKGWASDKNGISLVQISLDNGNTFNDAIGTEEWEYTFDTRVIQDGTHVVFLRVYDGYGIEGLYSSLITIDNTVPDITLELPLDDSETSGMLFFSGQTIDNVELVELYITMRALDENAPALPPHLERIDLTPDQIISQVIDITTLPDGFYNVELTGSDAGGNTRRVSRNIRLDKAVAATKVDLMYPMNGEHVQGMFNVYGTVTSETPIERLLLYVDGNYCAETEITSSDAFKFELSPELVSAGKHQISVRAQTTNSSFVESNSHYVFYEPTGPWITIDNFTMMDFAMKRPYLEGRAGYVFSQQDLEILDSKEVSKEEKTLIRQKRVLSVELSFDNGKTFTQVSKNGSWRYRIENDYLEEGYHFFIARATMENGETAVTRTIIQIDKTLPEIRLISPGEGGRFNEEIVFSGLAADDVGLSNVMFTLRSGDKSSYEVPAFIQGLYFDLHFWGATLWDVGIGLTFFDDNVKLQAQFGQFTQAQRDLFDKSGLGMRYGGNVFGMKLLANLAYVPFQYFLGPDWHWLSAGFALGANFSMFTETQSGKPQMLSAVVAQIEFPRVTLQEQKLFRTYSFYTEVQAWFLPTDVQAGEADISSIIPQISAGVRVNVF